VQDTIHKPLIIQRNRENCWAFGSLSGPKVSKLSGVLVSRVSHLLVDFDGHKNVAFMPVSDGLLAVTTRHGVCDRKIIPYPPMLALEHFDWN
jgi:hypothetical protein